jgi:hypothetical protein
MAQHPRRQPSLDWTKLLIKCDNELQSRCWPYMWFIKRRWQYLRLQACIVEW